MRTDDFDFELPRTAIAQHPVSPRDAARLLVVDPGLEDRSLEDRGVAELPGLLCPGDVLVVNDTRVIPARLFGRRGQAKVEVTLTAPEAEETEGGARWRASSPGHWPGRCISTTRSCSATPRARSASRRTATTSATRTWWRW